LNLEQHSYQNPKFLKKVPKEYFENRFLSHIKIAAISSQLIKAVQKVHPLFVPATKETP
jgi:hypothetical protein